MDAKDKQAKRARAWYLANKAKVHARQKQSNTRIRARRHGLTIADVQNMMDAQEGRCACCREAGPLCIDHNHRTQRNRGLLCHRCTTAFGLLKEDLLRIEALGQYLRSYSRRFKGLVDVRTMVGKRGSVGEDSKATEERDQV